jgi:undecaprenyl-diphosphatase
MKFWREETGGSLARLASMPALSRRLIASLFVAAVLVGLWLTMMLFGTGDTDRAILHALYAGDRPLLANVARGVTLLGDGRWVTFVAIGAGLYLMQQRRLATAVVVLLGTGLGRGLTELQKLEVNRLRPPEDLHLVSTISLSYPSGHSANAMMTYLLLAMLLPRERRLAWIAAALALTLLVGLSRVMLGVHWPTDVAGGWAYGALWTLLLVTADQSLRQNVRSRQAPPAQ